LQSSKNNDGTARNDEFNEAKMRKKDIDGAYVTRPGVRYTSTRKRVDGQYQGYSSLVYFVDGTKKLIINENGTDICLSDGGYRWLNYLPDNENWCMTAMYNQYGEIIEWYFDITKGNIIDSNGIPCMDDLFLDIVLLPNGEIVTLDENELQEALVQGEINQQDYQFAYRIYDQLMHSKILVRAALRVATSCLKVLSATPRVSATSRQELLIFFCVSTSPISLPVFFASSLATAMSRGW
jgi:predicted RNA-binding protein associated with RNAse of E/G family